MVAHRGQAIHFLSLIYHAVNEIYHMIKSKYCVINKKLLRSKWDPQSRTLFPRTRQQWLQQLENPSKEMLITVIFDLILSQENTFLHFQYFQQMLQQKKEKVSLSLAL